MQQLQWMTVLILLTGLIMTACGGNGAQEIFDTAELEELQNNPEHALTLYQEIVDKYPSTPLAKKAKERIKALRNSR